MQAPAAATFVSASTVGAVNVMLGFVPDLVIVLAGIDQTNPSLFVWVNPARLAGFGARNLKVNGADGVVTKETSTPITAYAGGDLVTTAETVDTVGKHVSRAGAAVTAVPATTGAGVSLPISAQHATVSALHCVLAWRFDK